MRYSLRTLLILLAVGPILLAWLAWPPIKALLFQEPRAIAPAAGEVRLVPIRGYPVNAGDVVVELPSNN